MAEIRIYHGKQDGYEPPRQLLRKGIKTASESTPSPAFCAGQIAHHSQVQHYRADFGNDTKGISVIAICGPDTNKNIPKSEVSDETISQIETELQKRLGAGYLAVLSVDESHRIDSEGTPRSIPKELDS